MITISVQQLLIYILLVVAIIAIGVLAVVFAKLLPTLKSLAKTMENVEAQHDSQRRSGQRAGHREERFPFRYRRHRRDREQPQRLEGCDQSGKRRSGSCEAFPRQGKKIDR